MENHVFPDPDYSQWRLLAQTRIAMSLARWKEMKKYKLSSLHTVVIFLITALDRKATPTEISHHLLVQPHTVSSILNTMEKKGLVVRIKDLPRKNQVRVSLTDKGRKAYQYGVKKESIHKVMSCLSEEENKQLRAILLKLRRASLKEAGIDSNIPIP